MFRFQNLSRFQDEILLPIMAKKIYLSQTWTKRRNIETYEDLLLRSLQALQTETPSRLLAEKFAALEALKSRRSD
jgi:hypothetical protein